MRRLNRVLSRASYHGGTSLSPPLVAVAHERQLSGQGAVALKVHRMGGKRTRALNQRLAQNGPPENGMLFFRRWVWSNILRWSREPYHARRCRSGVLWLLLLGEHHATDHRRKHGNLRHSLGAGFVIFQRGILGAKLFSDLLHGNVGFATLERRIQQCLRFFIVEMRSSSHLIQATSNALSELPCPLILTKNRGLSTCYFGCCAN